MKLTKHQIYSSNLPMSLSIALVSDLHECNPDQVLDILGRMQPDMVCVAGDTFERIGNGVDPRQGRCLNSLQMRIYSFLIGANDLACRIFGKQHNKNAENAYRFLRGVSRLRGRNGEVVPVFMSLGNHEWRLSEKDMEVIRETKITLLDNASVSVGNVHIGGLSTAFDRKWLEEFRHLEGYKILLCHHPEYYEKFGLKDIDLILSGHVHGGQVRIFGRGIFAPGQGFFPKYHHGVYDNRLVVSSGCANTAAIPRWGNPCEVVQIDLKK